jgi:predicted PolB exonuclease-like 3'-5' exonuclease
MKPSSLKTVVFDLETIPNPAMIPLLPEPEPAKNLKDPEKIKADIEEKRIKQVEEMALNPHTNLICCASFYDMANANIASHLIDPNTLDEKALLEAIWAELHRYDRFVTFNGNAFDVPCLKFHSMLRQVPMSCHISTVRYRIENHIDVRAVLGNWDTYAKGNLDWYCRLILGEEFAKTDGMDGAKVQHLWDCGCYEEIREYCNNDVRILAHLYSRMAGYYL